MKDARTSLVVIGCVTLGIVAASWTWPFSGVPSHWLGACPGPLLIPSPRTDWNWPAFADSLAAEVAAADAAEQVGQSTTLHWNA